jgi:hypothetical protein
MITKRFLTALLAVTTVTTTIAVSISPSHAAGPYTFYEQGNDRDFPTWHLGQATKLCVKNLHSSKTAVVTVNPKVGGNQKERISVSAKKIKCINRHWAGAIINVINSNGTPVEVWSR